MLQPSALWLAHDKTPHLEDTNFLRMSPYGVPSARETVTSLSFPSPSSHSDARLVPIIASNV